ncbi:butyrophilin subfamily 1 member A1-like [Mixophyes fleayi]|uniref:butyrophilin subfamily 1 member A1-like n=1 Tax=Mixophyes fleayi TaxID=3061075 RepID=UPI003F4E1BFB
MSAKSMEIKWLRNIDLSVIHLYRNGKDEIQPVDPAFHGRTYFIKDEIEKGNVSLRIQNIQPADEGLYTCYFQSEFIFDESTIEILPAAIGTSPLFVIEHLSGHMQVSCSSSGWYPKPEAQWFSDNRESLKETSKSITQNEDKLYSINIAINFEKESNKKSCVVQNSRPGHQREAVISLSDSIFFDYSGYHASIFFNVLFAILIFGICIWYKVIKKRKTSEDNFKEFKEALQNKVDVKLDPETAHPDLEVSEDLKRLSRRDEKENIPDNDKRFDTRLYVLGKEYLSANQNYWQVNVEDAKHWTIGVAYENVNRKGKVDLSPKGGFWILELDDTGYKVYTDHHSTLNNSLPPKQIGIYLNHKTEKLNFYDALTGQLMYSFMHVFTNKVRLFPFFSVWKHHESIHVCSDGCIHCFSNVTNELTHMLSKGKPDDIC